MPRKTFVAGEVLAAADVNTYLMDQAVMTFAGTAARGSAIASPSEGMFAYLEDSDTLTYFDGSDWAEYVPSSTLPGRNLLYNGAMQVAQRGTSSTGITSGGYKTADRWSSVVTNMGTWTQTVAADGPTGSGFTKSLKMECTTADGSPAASDRVLIQQVLEGQDLQALKKGTSSAESVTLSFWVKSNVTGTYIASLYDGDNNRHISASYTVSSSGTWEKKTITFAGDTTGAFDNDNAASLYLVLYLGAGTDYTSGSLATSWASLTSANEAVGQTNLAASTSNYWQVTGVQLEAGTVATTFEHKAYGVELAECQRYYWRSTRGATTVVLGPGITNSGNNSSRTQIDHPVPMRAAASSVEYQNVSMQDVSNGYAISNLYIGSGNEITTLIACDGTFRTGYGPLFAQIASSPGYFALSAEL